MVVEKRCYDLSNINMIFNGTEFIGSLEINKDFNVSMIEIKCDSDEEWNFKIKDLQIEFDRRIKLK